MAKTISITVHPSPQSGEYLTVSDAMSQILDMVSALDGIDLEDAGQRQIVWRLTEAHTNSPPFTVVAEAFSRNPEVSIALAADRAASAWASAVSQLMAGRAPKHISKKAASSLERVFKRNLNGVSQTRILIDGKSAFSIDPNGAAAAVSAFESARVREKSELQRAEFGTVECEVIGLSKFNGRPALVVQERLSGVRAFCVLSDSLAEMLGPHHNWSEVWEGRHIRFSGKLTYKDDGTLDRINATYHEPITFTEVSLRDLKKLDILGDKSVSQHIDEFWGERFG